jgi:hypothetical protein
VGEWQRRETLRNAALGEKAGRRNAKTEAANDARMAEIDKRLAKIDKGLASTFPNYAALASPAPFAADEVQAQLGADEALVLFFDTREWQAPAEETFVWVLTKTDIRWVRSDLGTDALTREVQDLRCGLDSAAWESVSTAPSSRARAIPAGRRPSIRPARIGCTRRSSARSKTSSKASTCSSCRPGR